MRRAVIFGLCATLLLAFSSVHAATEDVQHVTKDIMMVDDDIFDTVEDIDLTGSSHRSLLRRGGDDDEGGEGGDDAEGGGGTTGTVGGTVGNCVANGITFKKCYTMGAGKTFFSLNGTVLNAGYTITTNGWAALQFGTPHAGGSALWYTGAKAYGITMRGGFSSSSIGPPSRIKFSKIKAVRSGNTYSVTFALKWPGGSSVTVALANGANPKQQHYSIPTKYTLTQAMAS